MERNIKINLEEDIKQAVYPNWEVRWAYDKLFGQYIDIYNENSIGKGVMPTEGGIFDSRLGNINTDKEIREFTCKCGNLYGRALEGKECPKCNTKVEEQYGVNLDRFGWIDLGELQIIIPSAFYMLASIIGPTQFDAILRYDVEIDADGIMIKKPTTVTSNKILNKYNNIGLIEFKKKMVEILEICRIMKPHKIDMINHILKYKNRIFSSKIPVFSSLLRPAFASSSSNMLSYDKINARYITILNNVKIIRRGNTGKMKSSTITTLYAIQQELNDLYTKVIDSKLNGKEKLPRGKIMSNRVDYSARMVATSLVGEYAGVNHIVLNYKAFIEMYKLELINCMMRGLPKPNPLFITMTIFELLEYLNKLKYSDIFDPNVYEIIDFLVKNHKDGLWLLVGRNPSMTISSGQVCRIVHVMKDPSIKTCKIQLTSLSPFNGDFDGDEFNLMSLKEKVILQAFRLGLDPRNMMIDPTGKSYFNSSFNIIKDHASNLVSFLTPLETFKE